MPSSDIFALFLTVIILTGVIYLIVSTNKAMDSVMQSAKQSLKSKGLDISSSGIAVKTDKVFDRESYMDATQRGIINALNASSHNHQSKRSTSATPLIRTESGATNGNKHHGATPLLRSHSNQGAHDKKQSTRFWKGRRSDKESL